MKKLAIITTHPIQYNAPLFAMLHKRGNVQVKVFYTWSQAECGNKFDPGFAGEVHWDIPLLSGYAYEFVPNVSSAPGSHHFRGIDNPQLVNKIESWAPDAILIYGWSFKSHLKIMRYFHKKIPVLFRGDSTLLDEHFGLKQLLRRAFLKYIYSFIDIALYAGTANKAYFLKHGLKESQLVFMPHAADNDRFAATGITAEAGIKLRALLNIPVSATVFLFAGKLQPKKQPQVLAKLFAEINDMNAYLIIAGSGEMEEELRNTYGDHARIRFTGFQNQQQMPGLYAACDVFVLPSKGPGETWGLAVNEAMAAEKAVIVSDACGCAEDLVTKDNGFVFKKDDEKALKEQLLFFIDNKAAAIKMGKHSGKIISAFSYLQDCIAMEKAGSCKTGNF